MRGQLRVDSIYAFLAVDDDGTEGVPALRNVPMLGADRARIESLAPAVEALHKATGIDIELVRFTSRQHLAWVGKEPLRPAGRTERTAYRTFDEPVVKTDVIEADGIVVSGALVNGRPSVVITYSINGQEFPIAVMGQQAADLVPLVADAWESAKASES